MSTTSAGAALFSQTQQRVLAAFFTMPGRAMYVREAVRAVGKGSGPVQRELALLEKAGLLIRERLGNQVRYRANPAHPVFPELRGLILKTVGLVEPLRGALEQLADRIVVAFVFGSVAKAEDRAESDVDLLVVGDGLTLGQVSRALGAAQEALGREVTPVVYSPAEVRSRVAARNPFLTRLLAEPKLYVIGGADELGAVAGEPVAGGGAGDARAGKGLARAGRAGSRQRPRKRARG